MSAAETLRTFLAEGHDVADFVGDEVYLADDFLSSGDLSCIVVSGQKNPFRILYRATDDITRRFLGAVIKNRVAEMPLAEVIESVKFPDPSFCGRITVNTGLSARS